MKIVVIMPTYNEKINTERMIPVLEDEVFPKITKHDMWILVADDKSPDGTANIVRDFMKKHKNIELIEGNKEGLGAAYVRAMKHAMSEMKADAVIEFDADFQHDPHDIPRLVAAMDEGYDYVIGSRYIAGGEIPKEWGFDRKIKSIFGSLFARIVLFTFSIHDMTSGFKLTKTSYLSKVNLDHLYSQNYAYKLHILFEVVKRGAKVKEVPIKFYERTKGKSKLETNDIFESLWVVIKLRLRESQRIIKFLIVGGTGFLLQLFMTYIVAKLGVEQFIAAMVGAESAILSNYLLNNAWTFDDTRTIKERGNFFTRLLKFNTTSVISIGLQGLVVYLAVEALGDHLNLFGYSILTSLVVLVPTIILVIIPLNYLIYNKIIWKTQRLNKPHEKTTE